MTDTVTTRLCDLVPPHDGPCPGAAPDGKLAKECMTLCDEWVGKEIEHEADANISRNER